MLAVKPTRARMDAAAPYLDARVQSLPPELIAMQVETTLLERVTQSRKGEVSRGRIRMRELRGGDAALVRRNVRQP